MPRADSWPELPYAEWAPTLATLHRWAQIVGKLRLASSPWINHSWHATLYVTPVGLTTSTVHQADLSFDVEFDFLQHVLAIRTSKGQRETIALEPMSVASFHEELILRLERVGLVADIHGWPNEIPDPVPFTEDTVHCHYDPRATTRFSQVLNRSARVFSRFRSRFRGKCSPVHLFWGSFDLAVTRFSGRPAPAHPGGIPGLPDWITREAYSHEVCSCGFWPGGESSPEPSYYAYGYPVSEGLGDHRVRPVEAFWSDEMREWFLPYDAVRKSDDPEGMLMSFLQSTYEAVSTRGRWDVAALEVPEGFPREIGGPIS